MARKPAAPAGPSPAKRPRKSPGSAAPATPPVAEPAAPKSPEDLLHAGLKAFKLENLLGLVPPGAARAEAGASSRGFGALEGFGLRKFEDVFDQRVAAALRRMGWAGPEQFQALQQQVEQLQAELARLRRARRAPAPPARGDR